MDLTQLDLNLLVVLDALLEEEHVTRAAQRVGLSQSATSRALSRLREAFGDPLLVKTHRGMKPTLRAQALRPKLRKVLQGVGGLLEEDAPFDSAASEAVFRVCVDECGMELVWAPFLERYFKECPRVSFEVRLYRGEPLRDVLRSGEVSCVLGSFGDVPSSLHRMDLLKEPWACAVCVDHPLLVHGGEWDRAAYLQFEHIRCGVDGGVDAALEVVGEKRRVRVDMEGVDGAVRFAKSTGCMVTLPKRYLERLGVGLDLRVLDVPFDVRAWWVSAVWHGDVHQSPAHMWLREALCGVV